MSDQNDGNQPGGQQPGGQQPGSDWGDQPNAQPTGQPSPQQSPNPQGGQQPAGGEWSGGNNPSPQTDQAQPNANAGWDNDPQQGGGQMSPQPPTQAPASGGNDLDNKDIIAIILSFFFPGVGHMMLGQQTKGIVLLAVFIFTCGGLGLLPFASIFDAFLVAKTAKYRALDDWEFFPDMNEHL